MPISFSCPHCGRFTEVAEEYAGQSGPCAGCGQTITIPGVSATKDLSSVARDKYSEPKKSSGLIIVLAVLGVMCLCGGLALPALLLPAVQAARESARRMQCFNNLKMIGLAMHNYHELHNCLPAGFIADEKGKPLHSWRVALLPFLDRIDLYEQYNFDEPWDSPSNMRIADQMPDVFRCPSSPDSGAGSNLTPYVVVLGENSEGSGWESLFGMNRWTRFADVTDGLSNTLMVVESKEPVLWTQPDADLHFDSMNFQVNGPPPAPGSYHPSGGSALIADGSVKFLASELDPQTMRWLIQPADGNAFPIPR